MKMFIRPELKEYTQNEWYKYLSDQGKYVTDLIFKYHNYYKKRDRKHKNFVYIFKISALFFAMCNTIILGINFFTDKNCQLNIGLILSAVIVFLTTLSSFFNFEQYWMRNIVMHIELNKIRDNFVYEVKNNQMNQKKLKYYLGMLDEIQDKNINYWKNAIFKLK